MVVVEGVDIGASRPIASADAVLSESGERLPYLDGASLACFRWA